MPAAFRGVAKIVGAQRVDMASTPPSGGTLSTSFVRVPALLGTILLL